MKITVRVTRNFGPTRYYPVCKQAKLFLELINAKRSEVSKRKTLSMEHLGIIRDLGYEVEG